MIKKLPIILFAMVIMFTFQSCSKKTEKHSKIENAEKIIPKSFVYSCGSGCAMRYTIEEINHINQSSILVKFKVLMFINEEVSDTFLVDYDFTFDKSNTLEKILNEDKDVMDNLKPEMKQDFINLSKTLIKR